MKTKQSMVAMSGAIMPLPLAMPVIRDGSVPPSLAVRVAALANVSVVMMPRAASGHGVPRSGPRASAGRACDDALVRQNLADDAGGGEEDFGGRRSR